MSYRLLNRAMKGGFTQPPVHWAVLIGLAITGFYGRSAPGAPGITELTRHVSVDSYTRYLRDDLFAHDGDDRSCSGPEHDLARARIQQRFLGFGLFTSLT